MAVNPVANSNSKHIDVRHHFLREHVENGEFEILHVESKYQHAEFLTKPLAKDAFRFHRNFIPGNEHELIFEGGSGFEKIP